MNARHRVNVLVFALLGLSVLGFAVTLVMKARLAGDHVEQENRRRPAAMNADDTRPDWFRNLDRNTDGKVTRSEFVGTDEQFRRIDANGDGLISPQEAIAADEWFRSEIPR